MGSGLIGLNVLNMQSNKEKEYTETESLFCYIQIYRYRHFVHGLCIVLLLHLISSVYFEFILDS